MKTFTAILMVSGEMQNHLRSMEERAGWGNRPCCLWWGVILQFTSLPESIDLQHSQKLLERQFGWFLFLSSPIPVSHTSADPCFPFLLLTAYPLINNVNICIVNLVCIKKHALTGKHSRFCTPLLTIIPVTLFLTASKKEQPLLNTELPQTVLFVPLSSLVAVVKAGPSFLSFFDNVL